jgi:hypothetical protein
MRSFSVLIYLAVLWTSAAAAEPEGALVGRLVFFDGNRQLTLREAEGEVGDRITVELRHGASLVEAQVDPDGYFVASGPAGRYRLEYLAIGERAEFLRPQELEIEAGVLTCAGTVAVRTSHIENLGSNQDNEVTVTDECAVLWPRLYRVANRGGLRERVLVARTGPLIENPERQDIIDYAGEVALELGAIGSAGTARATFVHPLGSSFVNPEVYASVGMVGPDGGTPLGDRAAGVDFTAGAGLNVFTLDLALVAGFRSGSSAAGPPSGPVLGAYGRYQFGPFGFGGRYELLPNSVWGVFFDVRPVALLGALL